MALIDCPECGHEVSDQAAICPNCGVRLAESEISPKSAASRPDSTEGDSVNGSLLLAGGGLLVIGSFLPWISATTILGTVSRSGMDGGDGIITLIGGVVVGIVGFKVFSQGSIKKLWPTVVLAAVGALVVFDFVDVTSRINEMRSLDGGIGSYGAGLWAVVAGVALGVVGLVRAKSEPGATQAGGMANDLTNKLKSYTRSLSSNPDFEEQQQDQETSRETVKQPSGEPKKRRTVSIFGLKAPALWAAVVTAVVLAVLVGVLAVANQEGGGTPLNRLPGPPTEDNVHSWLKDESPELAGPDSEIQIVDTRAGEMYVSVRDTRESSCFLLSYSGQEITGSSLFASNACPPGLELGP